VTVRKQLEQVYKTTGIKPPTLANAKKLPRRLGYLWGFYLSIQNGENLRHSEIKAWSELTGNDISPQEISIIFQIESIKWKVFNNAH